MVARVEDVSKQLSRFEHVMARLRAPEASQPLLVAVLALLSGAAEPEQNAPHCVGERCLLTGPKDDVFGTCSLKLLSIVLCWGIYCGRRRRKHARLAGLKSACSTKHKRFGERVWKTPRARRLPLDLLPENLNVAAHVRPEYMKHACGVRNSRTLGIYFLCRG